MKYIVTEDQFDYMNNFNSYKKIFFKFWDKFGGKVDKSFLKMFGFDHNALTVDNKTVMTKSSLYQLLREWYGEENAMEKALEFLNKDKLTVDNCGGYNFDFEIEIVETDVNQGTIFLRVFPDYKNGQVELIMVGQGIRNLYDASNDEDYGDEIKSEVSECIHDYFYENITDTFGIFVYQH
jgi:hypothetical protein